MEQLSAKKEGNLPEEWQNLFRFAAEFPGPFKDPRFLRHPWREKRRTFRAGLRQSDRLDQGAQRQRARRMRYAPIVNDDGEGVVPNTKKGIY